MSEHIEIIRSKRKTVSIEITHDLRIIVRAPMKTKQSEIDFLLAEKSKWIQKHIKRMEEKNSIKKSPIPFSDSEIKELALKAKKIIPEKANYFAKIIGVEYSEISIRVQVSRWGSCSSKRNLNFNCLLMLCPEEVVDYVVIHELCHIKHMNHSKEFWSTVQMHCPDYKTQIKWLKDCGITLINRLRISK